MKGSISRAKRSLCTNWLPEAQALDVLGRLQRHPLHLERDQATAIRR